MLRGVWIGMARVALILVDAISDTWKWTILCSSESPQFAIFPFSSTGLPNWLITCQKKKTPLPPFLRRPPKLLKSMVCLESHCLTWSHNLWKYFTLKEMSKDCNKWTARKKGRRPINNAHPVNTQTLRPVSGPWKPKRSFPARQNHAQNIHPSCSPGPIEHDVSFGNKSLDTSRSLHPAVSKLYASDIARWVFIRLRSNRRIVSCNMLVGWQKKEFVYVYPCIFLFFFSQLHSRLVSSLIPRLSFLFLFVYSFLSRELALFIPHFKMTPKCHIPLRILKAVFSIVVLALSSYGMSEARRILGLRWQNHKSHSYKIKQDIIPPHK